MTLPFAPILGIIFTFKMQDRDRTLPLHKRLALARRAKGMAQSALAREAGCAQAAISMMENGKPDAIAKETMARIASILGVEIDDAAPAAVAPVRQGARAICPNPECPSNVPYIVGGSVAIWPGRQPSPDAKYCAFCGEVLERACPVCGAPLGEGAFCGQCGAAHVTAPVEGEAEAAAWVAARRREIADLAPLIR